LYLKKLLILFGLFIITSCSLQEKSYLSRFNEWKTEFSKNYHSIEEEDYRYNVFKKNLDFVLSHDSKAKGFTVAMNRFGDISNEEFKAMKANNLRFTSKTTRTVGSYTNHGLDILDIPSSLDWRTIGAVTPVKDDGECPGSCWAFSATGAMEGAWFVKTKELVSLSEQNLIDCTVPLGNMGCNGGFMETAFQYVISNKGIDTEASYAYNATDNGSCHYNPKNKGATFSKYINIISGNETDLLIATSKVPVSVAIDASQTSFQFYKSGIYYEPACSEVDDGLLCVGYGTEQGMDFWIVKNEIGTGWGEEGYIRMARNRNNNCGIATESTYVIA